MDVCFSPGGMTPVTLNAGTREGFLAMRTLALQRLGFIGTAAAILFVGAIVIGLI